LGNTDHDASIRIIHKALDAGINFVDTADVYSVGESEEIVGKAIKGRRDDVVLASKVHYPMSDDPNHQGNSRRWITTAVDDLLAGAEVTLDDEILDRLDEIAPPSTDAGPINAAYVPPAVSRGRARAGWRGRDRAHQAPGSPRDRARQSKRREAVVLRNDKKSRRQ
jgi:hypothetical protein